LRIDHLVSPPMGADIVAHAECYHTRAQIASVRGAVRASTDEGIATFAGSYILLGG
jgi:acyl-coenzyme A thioesterase PaaI-like protein